MLEKISDVIFVFNYKTYNIYRSDRENKYLFLNHSLKIIRVDTLHDIILIIDIEHQYYGNRF